MLKKRQSSPVEAQPPPHEAAREIGRHLREARLARGEQLEDIADFLRIRPFYLAALEAGEIGQIPGRPYLIGFVRSYTDYLELDTTAVMGALKPLLANMTVAPELTYPDPVPEARRGAGGMIAVSLALAAILYGGYYALYQVEQDGDLQSVQLPRELDGATPGPLVVGGALPAPAETTGEAGGTKSGSGQAADGRILEDQPSAPGVAAPAGPDVTARSTDEGARRGPRSSGPVPTAASGLTTPLATSPGAPAGPTGAAAPDVPRAAPPPPPPTQASAATAPAGELLAAIEGGSAGTPIALGRVSLVGLESSWIQVRSTAGDYVRTRTLEPGERFAIPDREDLTLWTGNAGGLEIVVDGQSQGPLGRSGRIIKGLPLSAERLKARIIR